MLFPILDIAIHSLIAIRPTQTYFLETRGCDVMVFLTDLNYGISQKISLIDAKSLGIDEISIWIYFIKDINWQIYSDSQNIINALSDLVNVKRKNYDIDRCYFYTNLRYLPQFMIVCWNCFKKSGFNLINIPKIFFNFSS